MNPTKAGDLGKDLRQKKRLRHVEKHFERLLDVLDSPAVRFEIQHTTRGIAVPHVLVSA